MEEQPAAAGFSNRSLGHSWLQTLAAWIVAGILLSAALLNGSEMFSRFYHFYDAGALQLSVRVVATLVEVYVAFALLQQANSFSSWFLASALFAVLATIAFVESVQGHATCDCFGTISPRPFYTAVLDVCILVVCLLNLLVLRNNDSGRTVFFHPRPAWLAIAFFLSSCAIFFAREAIGVPDILGAPQIVARLTDGHAGEGRSRKKLLNSELLIAVRGRNAVRLIGVEQSCGFQIQSLLPIDLSSDRAARIPVVIKLPREGMTASVPIILFVDRNNKLDRVALNLSLSL